MSSSDEIHSAETFRKDRNISNNSCLTYLTYVLSYLIWRNWMPTQILEDAIAMLKLLKFFCCHLHMDGLLLPKCLPFVVFLFNLDYLYFSSNIWEQGISMERTSYINCCSEMLPLTINTNILCSVFGIDTRLCFKQLNSRQIVCGHPCYVVNMHKKGNGRSQIHSNPSVHPQILQIIPQGTGINLKGKSDRKYLVVPTKTGRPNLNMDSTSPRTCSHFPRAV